MPLHVFISGSRHIGTTEERSRSFIGSELVHQKYIRMLKTVQGCDSTIGVSKVLRELCEQKVDECSS